MARPVTLLIGGVVAVSLVAGVILLWPETDAGRVPTPVSVAPVSPSGHTPAAPVQQANPARQSVTTAEQGEDVEPDAPVDAAPDPVARALESMTNSLASGDSRTPEMAPQVEREKPSAAVLADPERYADYEEQQSRNIAAVYLSMLKQIPTLRARIDAAKASGSKSSEDIAEAEEALAKLEELKRDMEATHPEMLQPSDADTSSDGNSDSGSATSPTE